MELSSVEVEYIAASLYADQTVWLMNLLKELGSEQGDVVTLMVDNVSAINLSKNPIAHERSKHIEKMSHHLRKLVSEGWLRLRYCIGEDQVADLLAKGISIKVFKRLKKNKGIKGMKHIN